MHAPSVALALAIVIPLVGVAVAIAYSPPALAWVLGRNTNQVLALLSASQPFGAEQLHGVAAVIQATGGPPAPDSGTARPHAGDPPAPSPSL
jgi:hypothetical protein